MLTRRASALRRFPPVLLCGLTVGAALATTASNAATTPCRSTADVPDPAATRSETPPDAVRIRVVVPCPEPPAPATDPPVSPSPGGAQAGPGAGLTRQPPLPGTGADAEPTLWLAGALLGLGATLVLAVQACDDSPHAPIDIIETRTT